MYPIKNALKENILYKPTNDNPFMLFSILPSADKTANILNMNTVPINFRTDSMITIKIQGKKIQSKMIESNIVSKIDVNKILTVDIQPFSIRIVNDILTIESTELLDPNELVVGNLLFSPITLND